MLVRAIKDAEDAADYLEYQAGIIPEKEYRKAEANRKTVSEPEITVEGNEQDTVEVYQLRREDDTLLPYLFTGYEDLSASGLSVQRGNYEKVYTGTLEKNDTLERLFQQFNVEFPKDYFARALAVSDVLVVDQDGKKTAHYVDRRGFREVPDFLNVENQKVQQKPQKQQEQKKEQKIQAPGI